MANASKNKYNGQCASEKWINHRLSWMPANDINSMLISLRSRWFDKRLELVTKSTFLINLKQKRVKPFFSVRLILCCVLYLHFQHQSKRCTFFVHFDRLNAGLHISGWHMFFSLSKSTLWHVKISLFPFWNRLDRLYGCIYLLQKQAD